MASAVLQLAQDQGRAVLIDPQQRGPPCPDILVSWVRPHTTNAGTAPSVPVDASHLPNDPNVAVLLDKVAELKHRMSARCSHGGLLADKAAQRAGSKFPNCVGTLAGASGGEAVTSAVTLEEKPRDGAQVGIGKVQKLGYAS